jgi:hypothetical protein
MAKARVPLLLRASFTSTEAEQPAIETVAMDLSAYVDPLNGKVLRISKVHFIVDDGSGEAMPAAAFINLATSGLGGGAWTAQLCTGTQTAMKGTNDNRNIATTYTYVSVSTGNRDMTSTTPSTTSAVQGLNWSYMSFPVPELGYYVAADTLTFMAQHQLDLEASIRHTCVIECEKVKLPPSDVNFLLVNQTITT